MKHVIFSNLTGAIFAWKKKKDQNNNGYGLFTCEKLCCVKTA